MDAQDLQRLKELPASFRASGIAREGDARLVEMAYQELSERAVSPAEIVDTLANGWPYDFHKIIKGAEEAAHAEGRRSAMEELAKEKERADRAERFLKEVTGRNEYLSRALADTQALLAQPLQQEGGEDWLGSVLELESQAKRVESKTVQRSMEKAARCLRLMGKRLSDNLQQASTAQADVWADGINPAHVAAYDAALASQAKPAYASPALGFFNGDPASVETVSAQLLGKEAASATDAVECQKCDGQGATHYPDGEWEGKCAACEGTGIQQPAQATPEGADLPPLPDDMDTVERIQLSSIDSSEFAELMGAYASAPTLDTAWAVLQYADKRMHAIMARRFALAATTAAEPVYQEHIAFSTWEDVTKERVEQMKADKEDWYRILYRAAPPQQVDTGGLPG